jgi:hypothetical protein
MRSDKCRTEVVPEVTIKALEQAMREKRSKLARVLGLTLSG